MNTGAPATVSHAMNEGDRVDMGPMGVGTVRVIYHRIGKRMASVKTDRGDHVECEAAKLVPLCNPLVDWRERIAFAEDAVNAHDADHNQQCIADLAAALRDATVRLAIARGTMRAMIDVRER